MLPMYMVGFCSVVNIVPTVLPQQHEGDALERFNVKSPPLLTKLAETVLPFASAVAPNIALIRSSMVLMSAADRPALLLTLISKAQFCAAKPSGSKRLTDRKSV